MRELKFRAWDGVDCMSKPFTLHELQAGITQITLDCTVMQYSGLKDKSGQEIYEGDIVRYVYQPKDPYAWQADAVAVISFESTGFFIKPISGRCITGWLISLPGASAKPENNQLFEVVGNIYQNPELLEPSDER